MSGTNQWGDRNNGVQVGYAASGTILTNTVHNYHAGHYFRRQSPEILLIYLQHHLLDLNLSLQ